jgi:hypothetical protein
MTRARVRTLRVGFGGPDTDGQGPDPKIRCSQVRADFAGYRGLPPDVQRLESRRSMCLSRQCVERRTPVQRARPSSSATANKRMRYPLSTSCCDEDRS